MKNRIHHTRRVAATVLSTMATTVAAVSTALVTAYLLVGVVAPDTDLRLRHRVTDVRDRGALSLEHAIMAAVLCAAAIALGAVIVNAINVHQNQIR